MALTKLERRTRIKMRIRKKINGTAETPRLAVYRSNKQIYVQVVDDLSGVTLLSACSKEKEVAAQTGVKKLNRLSLSENFLQQNAKKKVSRKLCSTEADINIMAE